MADVDRVQASKIQVLIDALQTPTQKKILEGGCGSSTHFSLPDAYLVGIDISEVALRRNPHLASAILGDIEDYPLPVSEFDVVICWDVLEHLRRPELALRNFHKTVKEGGLIVIKVPNVFSLKGLLTKFTPHLFHVWAYKRIFHESEAGQDGHAPFPTYLRFAVSPFAIEKFARKNNLAVQYLSSYEGNKQLSLRKNPLLNVLFSAAGTIARVLTLTQINVNHTEYIIVLRKG